jgi:hypothetical protein
MQRRPHSAAGELQARRSMDGIGERKRRYATRFKKPSGAAVIASFASITLSIVNCGQFFCP